jgi:uncharacterized membrane protein YkvA (DUF1232 family)
LRQPKFLTIYFTEGRFREDHFAMSYERAQSWEDVLGRSTAEFARNAETVRRHFWGSLKRVAAKLPFMEDLVTAYYCAFDKETPFGPKAALVGALAYFVLPYDFMPDILPALGFADDAAVLATAVRMVAAHIRPEHREAARSALARELDGGE